jgi:hypothetical protein
MLALFAAATLAAFQPAHPGAETLTPFPPIAGLTVEDRLGRGFVRRPSHCKDAARFQTGFEPALLFRDRDRAAARLRRLIDLPPAEGCLLGTRPALRRAAK